MPKFSFFSIPYGLALSELGFITLALLVIPNNLLRGSVAVRENKIHFSLPRPQPYSVVALSKGISDDIKGSFFRPR